MTKPVPGPAADLPRAAIIEIVERHKGPRYPYTGAGSVLAPNHLRINGIAVYATQDCPVTIDEIVLDGRGEVPFSVQAQLMARALRAGATPGFQKEAEAGADAIGAAVIEIPDVDDLSVGDLLDRPYVLLNGHRLYTEGKVTVSALAAGGDDRSVAMVTLTLLCRQLTVDDESLDQIKPTGLKPAFHAPR